MLKIEVVFVSAAKEVFYRELELPSGATVNDALIHSELYAAFPEAKGLAIGIYSKPVELQTVLKSNDRVEVYRALTRDPKDNRRLKAKRKS